MPWEKTKTIPYNLLSRKTDDPGAIIISPSIPLTNDNKGSYIATLKLNMHTPQILPQMIQDTKETRSGSLIVKCRNINDFTTVESALRKIKNISRVATIRKAGPKFLRKMIKNIPNKTQESILTDSLTNLLGASNFKLEKFFVYRSGSAYTQVVAVREDLAKSLLTSPSPKLQIGSCFYTVDL